MTRHPILNADGITWGYADNEDDASPDQSPRLSPLICQPHKPVETGMKWSYCKLCNTDLYMDDNGLFKERGSRNV